MRGKKDKRKLRGEEKSEQKSEIKEWRGGEKEREERRKHRGDDGETK